MKRFLTIINTLFFLNVFAQNNHCDCYTIFSFVSTSMEENSASYQHQVIEFENQKEYHKIKNDLELLSKEFNTQKDCLGLLSLYLSFIKDSHQWISPTNLYYPFSTFEDSISVKKFISENIENYPLVDSKSLKTNIEGNWITNSGSLKIQIQKNNTKGRSFVGLMKEEVKYYAKEGDVRIDFYEINNELKAVLWDYGLNPKVYSVVHTNNTLLLGRDYIFVKNIKETLKKKAFELERKTYFEKLSENTNYIRIHSFDYNNKKNIDSVLLRNHKMLINTKNLIIDIRNNPGGSDLAYKSILKYIFDRTTYKSPLTASTWVSKDNLKSYEESIYFGAENKQDSLEYEKDFKELLKNEGSFEPLEFYNVEIDEVFSYPKKVFVIMNKINASTAEGFVINASKSGKVTTIGENTAGIMSYAEWRRVDIPDFPAWISITRKKVQTENNVVYETIGLPPKVNIQHIPEDEWIDYTLKLIEK